MANHLLPATGSTYSNFVNELNARIDDALKFVSTLNTTPTNGPIGAVRWDDTNKKWIIALTANWATSQDLSSYYNININGTVGATVQNTGAFTTLLTTGIATLAANSTVGGSAIVTAVSTNTLTNKTLTNPVIGFIVNTGTLTLPTVTDVLVGRLTTDTLTNKTLTDPKFTTGSALKDANGVNLVLFPATVASAINYVTLNNSITAVAPSIVATGGDANISINIASKGTGLVLANGIQVVDLTSTQTLSGKVLTGNTAANLYNGGTVVIPAGADTLINTSSAQSLANKTFSASAFNGTVGATTPSSGAFTSLSSSSAASLAAGSTMGGVGLVTNNSGTWSINVTGTSGASTNATITNDNATASTVYLAWVTSGSGNLPIKVSTSTLGFNPSTGNLMATTFSGAGTGLTGTASSLTAGAVAWANVTGKPANISYFTNDSLYLVASGTIANATNASTVNMSSGRNDGTAYPVVWGTTGATSQAYSCSAVTITSSTGQLSANILYASGNITAYSDERVKTNWRSVCEDYVYKLANTKSGIYDRLDVELTQAGVGAQSWQKVLPETVITNERGELSVNYGQAALVSCIELAKEIIILKEEIRKLHASII